MKKLIAMFLSVVLIVACVPLGALTINVSAISDGDYTYSVNKNGEATITSIAYSVSGEVRIPAFFGEYPVTKIGERAFQNCVNITSILIPNSVVSISGFAFQYCTNLTSVTLPNGITNMGDWAFDGCTSLINITIPNSVTSIGSGVFCDCSDLTSAIIGNSISNITNSMFKNCSNLASIEIPDNVTSIGNSAFEGCSSLASVTMSENVTNMGESVFSDCSSLTSIEIPNNVTNIGYGAFSNCSSLKNLIIPDSVSCIENSTFYSCVGLESIIIGNGVTSIGYSAFEDCDKLQSITIGNKVAHVDDRAFYGCDNLAKVYINDIAAWCNIDFKCSPYYAYFSNPLYYADELYLNNELIIDLVIPDGVTSISASAFLKCSNIKSVTIPDSVTSIGESAFEGCYRIRKLYITDIKAWCNVDINSQPLHENGELYINGELVTEIVVPDSITTLKNYVFSGCTNITSVTIPDSVTSIGDGAFSTCINLTNIKLSPNITSIGSYAFNNTGYYNDNNNWEDGMLYIDNYLIKVLHPENINLGDKFVKKGTKIIADCAFEFCFSLKSITIPDSIVSIGVDAFSWCTDLTDVWYEGDEKNKLDIVIDDNNTDLMTAVWHYNTCEPDKHQYVDESDVTCENCEWIRELSNPGDVNDDGSINNKDLGLLMQYLNNWDVEIIEDAADVNGDGAVNNKDYGLLMQYLNNWDVELQ